MKRRLVIILALAVAAGASACGSPMQNDATYQSVMQEMEEEDEGSAWDQSPVVVNPSEKLEDLGNRHDTEKKETEEEETERLKPDASGLYPVDYVRTIDGDTLEVKSGKEKFRVRLIGVDTPESVHPDADRNSDLGKAASSYTETLLKDKKTLYLQYGTDPEDNYSRKLCYVWLRKDVDKNDEEDAEKYMLNAVLCKAGMAQSLTVPPNIDYAPLFIRLVKQARDENAGLWQQEGYAELWIDDYEEYENGQPVTEMGEIDFMDSAN